MTYRNYYRISLALPFILPLLFFPFVAIDTSDTSTVTNYTKIIEIFSHICPILFKSMFYNGIPYLILYGYLLYWIREKNEKQSAHLNETMLKKSANKAKDNVKVNFKTLFKSSISTSRLSRNPLNYFIGLANSSADSR